MTEPCMTALALGTLRLGTRRSALALAQSGLVADALRAAGHDVELVEVVTEGDRSAAAVTELGSTGVFVTELRQRLLAGDVDVAVHSLKDLPTAPAEGIAHRRRAAAARTRATRWSPATGCRLAELPAGLAVGTGSPRRAAQLRALGFGLDIVADPRQRRQPAAPGRRTASSTPSSWPPPGLQRLGRLDEASEILDPGQLLPAPGQGALAIECRADDAALARGARRARSTTPTTRAAVTAERALLADARSRLHAPRSAPSPTSRQETTAPMRSTCVRSSPLSTAAAAFDLSTTGPLNDAHRSGNGWRTTCSTRAPPT